MSLPVWMQQLFQRLSPSISVDDSEALADLRRRHQTRCVAFKLLIAANNQALELMADMEEALEGLRPFGMHYVRSQCARVLASVHRIIVQLEALSGKNQPVLHERFESIKASMRQELEPPCVATSGPLLLEMRNAGLCNVDVVGPKVACLAEAANTLDLLIPEGFVATSDAYRALLEVDGLQSFIDKKIQTAAADSTDALFTLSSVIQQAITMAHLPEQLATELDQAAIALERESGPALRLAVRSSALGEDTLGASFAGQYHSELNVPREELAATYKEIVASKYGVTAMSYRLSRGIRDEDVAMCVAFMRMINAVAGGVVYTRNPLGVRHDCLMVNATLGLPKAVVDGKGQSDLFLISRENLNVVRRTVAVKTKKYVCDPVEGLLSVDTTPQESLFPALNDMELVNLSQICLQLEELFGQPQDVEFALDEERRIYILQCRPLQVEDALADPVVELPQNVTPLLKGGVTACHGAAAGEIYVLRKDIDVVRCPDGAVAVTEQASPRWAPLLHRVAAMVACQGSIAGHLANVAREFGVPALFGLEDCVESLEGEGLVTVDADGCAVYSGEIPVILSRTQEKKRLMLGTPVHGVLERVLQFVTPLHLLEPESAAFVPHNCKSLHDITRYCHEMSVRLMFAAEAGQPGLQSLSKQLFHKVPMQYWVIDLGGGIISTDRSNRFILMEDIISPPMLALWHGMTAVSCEAPVPVNVKGFMSVLMEATTNPELETSVQSGFSMRNYFMISDEFCSLQSRFGFHFCTVEALVGNNSDENYASFQFKGGAADMERRILRARMVADLLEEFGFRCETKQDALFARIEGLSKEDMERRLKVLGYLIIHTRQLDMVMTDRDAVTTRRSAMLREIKTMLAM